MTQEEKELETWLPIQGYEGIYEISNLGRVKRLAYDKNVCNGGRQHCCERILKPQTRKHGYLAVKLSKECKTKSFLIHRLVATAFIPNKNNLPQVNHKDENPSNNCVDNLEWCNHSYNMNYGTCQERARTTHLERTPSILMYDKEGVLKATFNSVVEAEKETGIPHSNIIACCKGRLKTAKGYVWKYSMYK